MLYNLLPVCHITHSLKMSEVLQKLEARLNAYFKNPA